MREFLFAVSNVGITLGYVFLAIFVVPRISVRLRTTQIGAVGFFLLCGLHHLENVAHVLFMGDETVQHAMLSVHMLLIDVPQAICVWMFVIGLYLEIARYGGLAGDRALDTDVDAAR